MRDMTADCHDGCAVCGGLGFFVLDAPVGHPAFGAPRRCPCMRQNDQRHAYERAKRASDLDEDMLASMTFARYVRSHAPVVYDALRSWSDEPAGWQTLVGPTGRGKTHLLIAAVGALLARDVAAVYVVAPDLLARLRDALYAGARDAVKLDYLREAQVLALDDLGAEHATDWADEQFYRMLDYRYRRRLPTLIASNLHVRDWPYRLASRAQDRAVCAVHVMSDTDDYRLNPERADLTPTRAR